MAPIQTQTPQAEHMKRMHVCTHLVLTARDRALKPINKMPYNCSHKTLTVKKLCTARQAGLGAARQQARRFCGNVFAGHTGEYSGTNAAGSSILYSLALTLKATAANTHRRLLLRGQLEYLFLIQASANACVQNTNMVYVWHTWAAAQRGHSSACPPTPQPAPALPHTQPCLPLTGCRKALLYYGVPSSRQISCPYLQWPPRPSAGPAASLPQLCTGRSSSSPHTSWLRWHTPAWQRRATPARHATCGLGFRRQPPGNRSRMGEYTPWHQSKVSLWHGRSACPQQDALVEPLNTHRHTSAPKQGCSHLASSIQLIQAGLPTALSSAPPVPVG